MLATVLLILAAVFFALATANVPLRINLIAAGLLCMALAEFVPGLHAHLGTVRIHGMFRQIRTLLIRELGQVP